MHTNVDNKHKLIRNLKVTPASTHDSQVFHDLFTKNNSKDVWADSAYAVHKKKLPKGYRDHIHSKGCRNKLLSEFQVGLNHRKSKTRCRVEHVFGVLKGSMKLAIRSIGIKRAESRIFLSSLAYNIMRGSRLVA